ncbi:hypothetical protein ABTY59_32005 [Streptomyces sp. NPDC096079]|uniref:hypothetical protein n=1 Tax=Streptomyces sp. NPDC096079 TaxID=3155820 RepID=UPI00332CB369
MTTPSSSPRPDWRDMDPAAFDRAVPAAPLALVDSRAVARRIPAVPDRFGTEALFGDAPSSRRAARRRGPAVTADPQPDGLFDL